MVSIVERIRTLRWRLLVALALLAVVMLTPNGMLASWNTANGWVLAAVLAVLAPSSAPPWTTEPLTQPPAPKRPPGFLQR